MISLTYVCEGEECIGPFASRRDAERFIMLMNMTGETTDGINVVEVVTKGVKELNLREPGCEAAEWRC